MNEEKLALEAMEEVHGPIHKPMDNNSVRIKIHTVREVLTQDLNKFIKNPSSKNFNSMKMSMYWYQYWSQKETYDEVEE